MSPRLADLYSYAVPHKIFLRRPFGPLHCLVGIMVGIMQTKDPKDECCQQAELGGQRKLLLEEAV